MSDVAGRWIDRILAGAGLALLGPVLPVAAVMILLDDGAPVLFRQLRVGRGRQPFTVVKLRTMRDGQVTRTGRWLRATGLDEVTQLASVLRGEMGMVGPRPLSPEDVRRLGWEGPEHDERFAVRPGVTGLVQLLGTTSAERSRRIEGCYVARRGLPLDLEIMALTLAAGVLGKSRVRRIVKAVVHLGRPLTALGDAALAAYRTAAAG